MVENDTESSHTASRPVQVRRRHFRYLNITFANFSIKSIEQWQRQNTIS